MGPVSMTEATKPKILVFAYACAPGLGSEPGAGWGMVNALSQIAEPIVLAGGRHVPAIRKWEETAPENSPHFVNVPEPRIEPYMRWHRIPRFILYLSWLKRAREAAEHIIESQQIDAVAHFTYATFWLPTPATGLGLPSIWGPVGGGVRTPRQLWRVLGVTGLLQEVLDYVAVRVMTAFPAVRRTARTATVRVLQNEETLRLLPVDATTNSYILNHALFNTVPPEATAPDGRFALWVSPMQSRKGPRLVVEALARTTSDVPLVMVGDGPQRKAIERLAARLGVADRIRFTGWIERDAAVRYMNEATTVVFTGLREEGGLALTEAMHTARRLIVLDHGGAGSIARRTNDSQRVALIKPNRLDVVAAEIGRAMDGHFEAEECDKSPLLDNDRALNELSEAVAKALNG